MPNLAHRSDTGKLSDRPDTLLRPQSKSAPPRRPRRHIGKRCWPTPARSPGSLSLKTQWCVPGRIVENAIEYAAAAAGDAETVAELLAENDRDLPYRGRIWQLLRCARWLPAELLYALGVPRRQ